MFDNEEIKILLGKRIKELRKQKSLSQEQLAEKLEIGQRSLSKIECGNTFISAETMSKLLTALNIKPAELFNFEHNNEKEVLKEELKSAIDNETVDINLMYRFYQSIK